MRKSDVFFTVTVQPVFYVTSCPEKLAQESRGAFGCHLFASCPNCQVAAAGWEFWGENGHRQGSARDREHLTYWLKRKAREQWKTQDGRLMGYRFRVDGPNYYRAN